MSDLRDDLKTLRAQAAATAKSAAEFCEACPSEMASEAGIIMANVSSLLAALNTAALYLDPLKRKVFDINDPSPRFEPASDQEIAQ
jgi:hypothetical protein